MNNVFHTLKDVKKVGLFGIGESTLGVAEYLNGKYTGAIVVRSDVLIRKDDIPFELRGAKLVCGKDSLINIDEDILFLSPSVRRDRPELLSARSRGVILSSEIEAFLSMTRRRVFAVSGSDGKSTTCELAYRLLKASGKAVDKSGNCGKRSLPLLDKEVDGELQVVELSSFMLEYMQPRLFRSVITNVTENHLDWHGSFESYVNAKENIAKNADEAAIWYDDPICCDMADRRRAEILISSRYTSRELAGKCERAVTLEGDKILLDGNELLGIDRIKRREPYNIKNFMSAAALVCGYFDKDALVELALSYDGIEHRCKSLGSVDGVEYIDSSIDSSPARTAQTLMGLDRKVVLILGGRGKGLSYFPLCEPVKKKCLAVVLSGENASDIKRTLLTDPDIRRDVPIYEEDSFGAAVRRAMNAAPPMSTVLLSPASTSYNEFKNFEERGRAFREIVFN